jgi:hypothetical protein
VYGLGGGVDDCRENGGAERIWDQLGHRVQLFEQRGRFGAGEQQRSGGRA